LEKPGTRSLAGGWYEYLEVAQQQSTCPNRNAVVRHPTGWPQSCQMKEVEEYWEEEDEATWPRRVSEVWTRRK
jgi:hypothetical protein